MSRSITLFASAVLCLLATAPAHAQNLVVNGNFNSDLSSWGPPVSPSVVAWDPLDWAANPSSGSLRLTNLQAGSNTLAVASQCVQVAVTQPFEVGARVRFPSGQAPTGSALATVRFFDNTTCTFPSFGGAAPISVSSTSTDTWVDAFVTGQNAPAGTLSAQAVVIVIKNDAGGSLTALFDRFVYGQAGTTPVELQSFQVE